MSKEKILFFIADFVPTDAERVKAAEIGTKMFRSIKSVHKTSPVEKCDYVAGCVPELYSGIPVWGAEAEPVEEKPKRKAAPVGKAEWKPNA